MQFSSGRHLPSIRFKLVALVLGCAAPILAGYVAFAHDADQRERAHKAEDAGIIAHALASAVDRDLDGATAAALALAQQAGLAGDDLAAFHASARSLLRPGFPATALTLSDAAGRTLLDTRRPWGTPLAPRGAADLSPLFAGGDSVIDGVRLDADGQPTSISIAVPVWRGGRVVYALSLELRARRLAELLADQPLPEHWSALVFDGHARLAARSGELPRTIGQPMRAALVRALAQADGGQVATAAPDGRAIDLAYAHTRAHGWTVAVGFPHPAAPEVLGPSPLSTLAGVAAMLALSLGLAWRIGGAIARSVRALTEPAAALGRGEPVVIPPLAIREAASVARALRRVEVELQQYRAGLESLVAERTKALRRSSALLTTVYASAPVGLSFLDRELRIVMVNDYLAAVNALPASAHIGRTLPELLGERGVRYEAPYRRVLASGRPLIDVEDSVEVPAEPGVTRHWICSYYPVYGPERELAGINAVVLDITERKRHEQRERDNEELFRALFEGAGDAHVLIAHGAGFVSANPAAVRLFGCASLEQFLEMSPASASPPCQPDGQPSIDLARAYMERALAEGGCQFAWVHQRRDGSLFHADVLLTAVDIGGRGVVQGTIRDITARVETELRLEQSERMIRTVTDHLPALVGYWDAGLRCRFANRPYLEWLGRSAEQVIGHTAAELMDEDQMAQVQPYVDGVLAGRPQFFERRLQRRDAGQLIHAWGSYIPDLDAEGRVRGFYMLHADVTELKRTQSRLEQALRAAEAASSAKGEFLANMSHEIRTPMNAIMGLARVLEETDLGRRERGYVTRIRTAARSLLSMLNDVLDYSKVAAGQLALEATAFRLDEVLSSIAVLSATGAWNKGIEPVFAIAPDVPPQLTGDPLRLEQVLLNLVGNAIKFTERGEVVLAVGVAGREPDPDRGPHGRRVRLAFTVRDTGIGIAPEQQQRMFEAFSQADSSTSRKYGGTGLGLAISRRLVGLMGGHLDVDSRPGEGASFGFTVPFGIVEEAAPPLSPPPGPDGGPRRALVADDNASSGAALAALLSTRGWQVDGVADGEAALARLHAARYDLVMLDCAMPGADGLATLARARAALGTRMPRCALLTADPERERLHLLAASLRADALLAKPFTAQALDEALAELLGDAPAGPARPARAGAGRAGNSAAPLAGLRVLVVEDNPLNQEVAHYVLAQAGADADFAANGRIGLDMLDAGVRYDAVLMDLQMPEMDGFEASAAIRRLGLPVPIVAMTANAFDDDRKRALEAGMDAWVAKPIDVDALVATLARITGRGAREPAQSGPGPTPHPNGLPAAGLPGIDLADALPRVGGDASTLVALLRRFGASQGGAVAAMRAQLAAGERRQAAATAHRLRGVAANLGAAEVARRALALERALQDGDAPAQAACLDALDAALQIVLDGLPDGDRDTRRPAPSPRPANEPGLAAALAHLIDLLQNNNMKAMAQWDTLRPTIRRLAPAHDAALADAVAELRFEDAAAMLLETMKTMEAG